MAKVRTRYIEIKGEHFTKCTTETLIFNGITISLRNFLKQHYIQVKNSNLQKMDELEKKQRY